jgi:hypothetical protein
VVTRPLRAFAEHPRQPGYRGQVEESQLSPPPGSLSTVMLAAGSTAPKANADQLVLMLRTAAL